MGAPPNPTATTICTEALKRFLNGGDPKAADITRAENYGLEKVKRDIMNVGKTWAPLVRTDYLATAVGVARYANPSDFEQYREVNLMRGDHSGALSSVTSTSQMSLAVGEDAVSAEVVGKWLFISGGTGANQCGQISAYSGVQVTLKYAFETLPVVSDSYLIVNRMSPLVKWITPYISFIEHGSQRGIPVRYAQEDNDTEGLITLNPVPDAIYGIKRTYYADLMQIDVSFDIYDTILRRWAGILEQGVYVWALAEDDDRYKEEVANYQDMLLKLAIHDLDGFVPPESK